MDLFIHPRQVEIIHESQPGANDAIYGSQILGAEKDSSNASRPVEIRGLAVRRSNGKIDQGWSARGVREVKNPETGDVTEWLILSKNDSSGRWAKMVSVDDQIALEKEIMEQAHANNSNAMGGMVARMTHDAQPPLLLDDDYPVTQQILRGRLLSPDSARQVVTGSRMESDTADRLLHEWNGLEPQVGLEVDGRKMAFSQVMNNGKYKFSVGYTRIGYEVFPRLFYKSHSDGGWRVTPGMYTDDSSYSKGDFHMPEYGQYVQATKPTEDVTAILAQLEKQESHITVPASRELRQNFLLSRRIVEHDASIEDEVKLTEVRGRGLDAFLSGKGFRDPENVEENRWEIEHQELPRGFKPDFSREPVKKYAMQHTLLGECKVDVYPAQYQGRIVDWHVAHDGAGRIWVDRIVPRDAKMTSYGTSSEVIIAGILSSKPIDYTSQVKGAQGGGVDIKEFDETYSDLSPTLNRQPWLKEYRRARGIYQQ